MDHFSKFCQGYLLINKKKESIFEKIKIFFDSFGLPQELGTDNGKEFLNKSLLDFLNEKGVKLINGGPYNPHSQGAVERIHLTLRKAHLCYYLENVNDFDLVKAYNKVVFTYNTKVTGYCPFEIFYSTDRSLFKKVHHNIIEYYEKSQKHSINYEIGEKCLLINNIIITKKNIRNY